MRKVFTDLTDKPFGKWYVIRLSHKRANNAAVWLCRCQCGTEKGVSSTDLTSGKSTKCRRCSRVTHGQSRQGAITPEYRLWNNMIQRCTNPRFTGYYLYGGRGIKVCSRWANSFDSFFADVGSRPSSRHSLDRYPDRNGDYKPGNVRWATPGEQMRNKNCNVNITFQGKTQCLADWIEELGTTYGKLRRKWRLK